MAKKTNIGDNWFEVSDTDWLDLRFKPKKLKLIIDAQVPRQVVNELARAKIRVTALDPAESRAPDPRVLEQAHGGGAVLLTLDKDFWDDRKYPLQSLSGGIIYVAEPPASPDRIIRAFGLVYSCFAKSYPLDWWEHMKVKATVGEFEIKMRTWQGNNARYRMKLRRGYVVAKELEA